MSSPGGTDGGTASLFPESESAVRKTGVDLRKAGPLLAIRSESPRDLEDTSSATDLRTGDLFAWGARQDRVSSKGAGFSLARAGTRQAVLQGPGKGRTGRLTRCLDGGRSDRGVSDDFSRRVRRNRVLFLVLFAGLALLIIAGLLFGR